MSNTPAFPTASLLGYPRIGRRRELKNALESFWAGEIDQATLEAAAGQIQLVTASRLTELGLDEAAAIPGTFSFYDQVLDVTTHIGAEPGRFAQLRDAQGQLDINAYFTLARGTALEPPLEMTKWFDSNYHYLVPEIGPETNFSLTSNRIVEQFQYALDHGFHTRPYLVGPVTYLLLSKASHEAPDGFSPLSRIEDILPIHAEILTRLSSAGASWIQLDEPALVADHDVPTAHIQEAVARSYEYLSSATARPAILVSTPFGSLNELLPALAASNIEALHFDVFKREVPTPAELVLLAGKTVVAGVVEGHNIWRNDLAASAARLDQLRAADLAMAVSTSTSTQHVPHDIHQESQLGAELRSWLAFADQKAQEVLVLADNLSNPAAAAAAIAETSAIISSRANTAGVRRPEVRARVAALATTDFSRSAYAVREVAKQKALTLPALPTTTIGSFPQTSEIRAARARANRGAITATEYSQLVRGEIKRVVELQEELGFVVLVHGEPERNDMVQYFAENLGGFSVTVHGGVQSYGSRCTRPSIL